MIRKAFLMRLNPGRREEYERRHNPVWPEVEGVLRAHGVRNYSILHEPGSERLFSYAEVESEESWRDIAGTEARRRCWAHMKELMLTNPYDSPASDNLDEVFHLD